MFSWSGPSGGGGSVSGTNAEMLALSASNGSQFYNTTFNTWFQYIVNRWLPLGKIDPRYGFYLEEDFFSNVTTFQQNWSIAATVSTTTSSTTSPAKALLRQATASARASIALQAGSTMLGASTIYTEWAISFPTLGTVAEDYSASFGHSDAGAFTSGSLGVDGICISSNRGVNGDNWILNTVSNSVATSTNTTTPIVVNTLYRLGTLITNDTSVEFYINGALVGTHATNIPSGAARATGYQARIDKIAGTGNSDVHLDYFASYGLFNSARVD